MATSREQLIFDVMANTSRAGANVVDLGRKVGAASDDVMGLAKRLDQLSAKSATARVKVEGDKEATATLDKLDLKMATVGNRAMRPNVSVEGAARAAVELGAIDLQLDKIGGSGGSASKAAAGTTALASPMAALIASGAVLSPMLITLGIGTVGLGAAAYGVAKPIENAASKVGGLRANLALLNPEQQKVATGILALGTQFAGFEKQMQPAVFGVFNAGLALAGHLLHDVQPVAKATGAAFGSVLGQIDKEFQSGTWQQFFGFMAATAGPDLAQLGGLFTGLLNALPPLIEGLQPLASGLIGIATDLTYVVSGLNRFHLSLPVLGASIGALVGGPIGALAGGLIGLGLEAAHSMSGMQTAVARTIPAWTKSASATTAAAVSLSAYGPQVTAYIAWLHKMDQAGRSTIEVQKEFAGTAMLTPGQAAMTSFGAAATIAGRGILAAAMDTRQMNAAAYLTISPTDHLGKVTSAAGAAGWYLSKAVSASSLGVLHLGSATVNTVTSTGHFARVAVPLTVTLHDWSTNASQAAISTVNMANAVNALNTAQAKALGNLVTYSGDILTTANDAVSLRAALRASGNEIGTHTGKQRASFSAANTFITDLSSQAQAAIASGKGVGQASRAIQANLPLLDAAKSKSRLYWQEVQTLTSWLHKLKDLKNISEVVVVRGSGTWTMHNPSNQSLPGGFPGGVGAASGMYVRGGTPGRDSVLINAMPGELVVPTPIVASGAVDHLRGSIPGFASGGVVPTYGGNVPGLMPWITGNSSAQIKVFGQSVASALLAAMRAASAQSAASFGHAGPGGGAPSANAALARSMFPGENFAAWNYVAMRESGWNQFARNPSSGAYGIAQALPPTKYPFAGQAAGGSNPAAQISWMEGYMRSRYGGAAGAAAHEAAFNWYDGGGFLYPGKTLAVNTTGQPERVTSPAQETAMLAALGRIEKLLAAAPDRTGAAVGGALDGTSRRALAAGRYSPR